MRDEQPGDAVVDELRQRGVRDRHDGRALGHRLDHGVAEGVDLAGEHEHRRPREQQAQALVAGHDVGEDAHAVDLGGTGSGVTTLSTQRPESRVRNMSMRREPPLRRRLWPMNVISGGSGSVRGTGSPIVMPNGIRRRRESGTP